MFSNLEKFSSITKALFSSQCAAFNALASQAVEGAGKIMALNIAAAKAHLAASESAAGQLLAAKEPQEWFAIVTTQTKQKTDNAASYGRQLTEIASNLKVDFTKAAHAHIADSKNTVNAFLVETIKSAPNAPDSALAVLKPVRGDAAGKQVAEAS